MIIIFEHHELNHQKLILNILTFINMEHLFTIFFKNRENKNQKE
jgi:hypothetical protein